MLRAWRAPFARPTMNIDLLGRTSNDEVEIRILMQKVLAVDVPLEGLVFDSSSIITEAIAEEADYKGVRLRFPAFLGTARIAMQVDIGFSDQIYPKAEVVNMPSTLEYPAFHLLCYSRESVIAEKFEAMVALGELKSRMKDFYDFWLLSCQFNFEGKILSEAIALTFNNRCRLLPDNVISFSERFIL